MRKSFNVIRFRPNLYSNILIAHCSKYEKSKQLTLEIKENETKLLEKLEFAQQQMKLQEQRYDKLKNHAFTQLEK